MIAADGREVWLHDMVAVEAEHGRAKTLRGIMVDITARKTAEDLVRESEQRYRTLAETATDAIITVDPQSRILFANAAAEHMFGYDRQELMGMALTALMPERFRDAHQAVDRAVPGGGTPSLPWSSRELTGLRRDGGEIVAGGGVQRNPDRRAAPVHGNPPGHQRAQAHGGCAALLRAAVLDCLQRKPHGVQHLSAGRPVPCSSTSSSCAPPGTPATRSSGRPL